MGKQLIHISKVHELATRTDAHGQLVPFTVTFIKLSTGEIITGTVVCTSKYFQNRTLNLKWVDSSAFRTIRIITIIAFNGIETYI